MSSGTSVPSPRTSRTIGPRFTVSDQMVARSTVGGAGPRRERPNVVRRSATPEANPSSNRRMWRFRAFDSRGMSIVDLEWMILKIGIDRGIRVSV